MYEKEENTKGKENLQALDIQDATQLLLLLIFVQSFHARVQCVKSQDVPYTGSSKSSARECAPFVRLCDELKDAQPCQHDNNSATN